MKIKLFLFLTVLFLASRGYAQKGVVESGAPTNPIVIDAVTDEWPEEWLKDPKGKFFYNVCNDNDNLYLRLKITDDLTQRKVGLFGMTVFLNPTGKKPGKFGLKYPIAKDLDELQKNAPKGQQTPGAVEELKNALIKDEQVLEIIGLSKENITSSRLGLLNGMEVLIRPERGAWYYEAKIPFKAYRIDKASVKVLGVAFVSGKMVLKQTQSTVPAGGGAGNMAYGRRAMPYGYGGGYGGGYGSGSSAPAYSAWNSASSFSVGVKLK